MRYRENSQLIDLLNNVRTANLNSHDINLIQSRNLQPEYTNYPKDRIHIHAGNAKAFSYDHVLSESIHNPYIIIKALHDLLLKLECFNTKNQ